MGADGSDATWQGGQTWHEGEGPGDGAEPAGGATERYTLRELLGRGSSGKVWLAWDEELQREVAYKALNLAPEGQSAQRFLQEARLTASLEHPGIVPVHDVGRRPDGGLYYVMQVIRGRALHQWIKESTTTEERLALVEHLVDACLAVAYAHERGIIHRDLKPQNIMVGDLGEVRVVDWGLARDVQDEGAPRAGLIVGSPRYMSPEQALGRPVDARTDVWALGTILYELLAGRPRVEGDSGRDLVERIGRGELPAVEEMSGPPELVAIAARALEADPARRYPDAGALAKDLKAWRSGKRVSAYQYSLGEMLSRLLRRYRWQLTGLAVGLALVGLAVADGYRRTMAERDRALEAEQISLRSEADAVQARRAMARALQHAYLGEAGRALDWGDPVGALIRAAAALELGDEPRSRGIAAYVLYQIPYRWLGDPWPTPERCLHLLPWNDGSWMCRGMEGVWRLHGDEVEPIESGRVRSMHRSEDGSWLIIGDGDDWWKVMDPLTSEVIYHSEQFGLGLPRLLREDGEALITDARHVSRVDLKTGEVKWSRRVASLIGRVAWVGDQVHVAQAAGMVTTVDARTGVVRGDWPERARGGAYHSLFARDGGTLLYASMGGAVGLLRQDGTRIELRGHDGRRALIGWSEDEQAVWASDADGVTVWSRVGEQLMRLPSAEMRGLLALGMRDPDVAFVAMEDRIERVGLGPNAAPGPAPLQLPEAPIRCIPEEGEGVFLCSLVNNRMYRMNTLTGEGSMVWEAMEWANGICHISDEQGADLGYLGTRGTELVHLLDGSVRATLLSGRMGNLRALECGSEGSWATAWDSEVWFGRGLDHRKLTLESPVEGIVWDGRSWLLRTERSWARYSVDGEMIGPVPLEAWDVAAVNPSTGKAIARVRDGLAIIDIHGDAPDLLIDTNRTRGPAIWVDDERVAVADSEGLRVMDASDGSVLLHVDDHHGTLAMLQIVERPEGPLLLAGDHEARVYRWDLRVLEESNEALVSQIGRATGLRVEGAELSWVER